MAIGAGTKLSRIPNDGAGVVPWIYIRSAALIAIGAMLVVQLITAAKADLSVVLFGVSGGFMVLEGAHTAWRSRQNHLSQRPGKGLDSAGDGGSHRRSTL